MEKVKEYLPIAALLLMIVVLFNTCGTKGKIKSLTKKVDKLEKTIEVQEEIISKTVSEDDLKLIIEAEGIRISKRNLYDQNSIVRSKTRPDDRMNEYDKELKAIEKKLK